MLFGADVGIVVCILLVKYLANAVNRYGIVIGRLLGKYLDDDEGIYFC